MAQNNYPTTWVEAKRALESARKERENITYALGSMSDHPELQPLVLKILELSRRYEELMIAQPNKRMGINIGGEDSTGITEAINEEESSHVKVRKAVAKQIARQLYSKVHPDLGGEPEKFQVVREAAKSGDLETLKFMRMSFDESTRTDLEVKNLVKAIEARRRAFQGSPSFKLGSLYYSNRPRFILKCKAVLEQKAVNLQMKVLGMDPSTMKEIGENS